MSENIIVEAKSAIHDRVENPVLITLLLSEASWNWKVTIALLFGDSGTSRIELAQKHINAYSIDCWCNFIIFPILVTMLVLVVFPYLKHQYFMKYINRLQRIREGERLLDELDREDIKKVRSSTMPEIITRAHHEIRQANLKIRSWIAISESDEFKKKSNDEIIGEYVFNLKKLLKTSEDLETETKRTFDYYMEIRNISDIDNAKKMKELNDNLMKM